jgi:hypothetical protein
LLGGARNFRQSAAVYAKMVRQFVKERNFWLINKLKADSHEMHKNVHPKVPKSTQIMQVLIKMTLSF